MLGLEAENEPVGTEGVLDGERVAQELGIPRNLDLVAGGGGLVQQVADAGRGADGDGRLHRDDGRVPDAWCELADGGEQVGEVVGVLAGLLRGADPDEVQVGVGGGPPRRRR